MTTEDIKEMLFSLESDTCLRCRMTVVLARANTFCRCRCGAFYWMEQTQKFHHQPRGIIDLLSLSNYFLPD